MKTVSLYIALALLGCSSAASCANTTEQCSFNFKDFSPCQAGEYTVTIQGKSVSPEASLLQGFTVAYAGKQQALKLSDDISIGEGDKGYISFDDTNLDGIADIAISTSSGKTNLYMDYWVFDKAQQQFRKMGNYTQSTGKKKR